MTDESEGMGPVSYLIVEFPGNKMTGEGFQALVDLVDRGLIRILDLEFVTRDEDGSVTALSIAGARRRPVRPHHLRGRVVRTPRPVRL